MIFFTYFVGINFLFMWASLVLFEETLITIVQIFFSGLNWHM